MDIVIQRGIVKEIEELPNYSIAIDGFVSGPIWDCDNHKYSFDHHGKCIRGCTTSSCFQVWSAISLGLDPQEYTIYINDVDLDTCMSIWCINNPDRCGEPKVFQLISAINVADMFSGAIPINGMTKIVEWISAPETDSKRNNDYEKLSQDGLNSVLEAVLHRIELYVNGDASAEIVKQPKHGEYKILRNENNWVLIESNDPHVLAKVFNSGFERIVKIHHLDDGSMSVTIAKKSDITENCPIPLIMSDLNALEPGWGGGTSVIGAPRNRDGSRSRLSVDSIIQVMDNRVK